MEQTYMYISKWKKSIWKGYILYVSNYMAFWKWQNYGDSKNSVVARVSRGENESVEKSIFKSQNIMCVCVCLSVRVSVSVGLPMPLSLSPFLCPNILQGCNQVRECPWRESNPGPFSQRANTLSTEPNRQAFYAQKLPFLSIGLEGYNRLITMG